MTRAAAKRTLAALAAGAALLVTGPAQLPHLDAQAELAVPASACDWDVELLAALDDRGEQPPDWTITPDSDGPGLAWASYDHLAVTISRDVLCRDVRSVVNHEWMHLQQARMYGSQGATDAYRADPERMEMVADCGSMLLGSTNLPYLEEAGRDCLPAELAEAQGLIAYQPLAP